jgi:hypothetical protein
VSTDGVRSDIYLAATPGPQEAPALAGGRQGFLISWVDSQGVKGRPLNAVGEPVLDSFTISGEANASAPDVQFGEDQYLVTFRRGVGSQSVRGQLVSSTFSVSDALASTRLSTDSLGISDLVVAPTSEGFFVAWDDARHQVAVPAFGGIYGNGLLASGAVQWTGDVGLHVDGTADLGGLAAIDENLLVATRVGTVVGVVVRRGD